MYRVFSNCILALLVLSLPVPASAVAGGAAATAAAGLSDSDAASRAYFTDLELINQDGEKVRFFSDVLKDRVVLINFIFTHCEDACPMLTHKLIEVRKALGDTGDGVIFFVSMSIDPQRDTPEAMKAFAKKLGSDDKGWIYLTGDPDNVNQIVKKLGQYSAEVEMHSTLLLAGNVKTRHWMKIPPNVPVEGIADKLRLLAEDGAQAN